MMVERDGVLVTLEHKSATLYLVAGVVMAVFVADTALQTYQGTSYPPVQQFIAPAGFLIGVIGLIGLYRSLSKQSRRLARVALAVTVVAALTWTAIVTAGILETAGVIPENATFSLIASVIALFSMVLAYGLFGITSVRTGVYQRAVSGLLLLEAVTFIALIANYSLGSLGIPVIVFEVGHLVVHLGLGITLRGNTQTGPAEPATDPTP
jgi:hypothetical protein